MWRERPKTRPSVGATSPTQCVCSVSWPRSVVGRAELPALLLRLHHPECAFQFERQHRLCRHLDPAFGHNLTQGSRARARPGPDGSTFPAARDGSDDGADGRAAAGELTCALVLADSGVSLLFDVAGIEKILLAFDRNTLEVEHQIGRAAN